MALERRARSKLIKILFGGKDDLLDELKQLNEKIINMTYNLNFIQSIMRSS